MDRLARRFVERTGARALVATWAGALVLTLLVGFLTTIIGWRGLELSTAEFVRITLVAEAVTIVGFVIGWFVAAPVMRPTAEWLRGGSAAIDPRVAWEATVRLPYRLGNRILVVVSPLHLLITDPFVVAEAGLPAIGYVPIAVLGQGASFVSWFLCMFGSELIVRPIAQDISSHLPSGWLGRWGWGIGTRTLLPVPLVALLAASLATAFAWGIDDPSARLATGVALAAISALAWLGLFKVLITDPVLRPISDLTAAVDRVRADDLSTPVPLTTSDELGELAAAFNRMQDGLREREKLASDNVELVEELRASRLRIVEAGDRERRRLERDLHDGAQQRLVSVAVALRLLERHLPPDGDSPATTLLEQASSHAEAAITEIRELARGIHPQVLTEEGLEAALSSLAQRANLPVEVRTSLKRRLPARVEAAAYFVCSEGLANVDKYADATKATLSAEEDGMLTVVVGDDGKGGATMDRGSGLRGLSDRVSALGGTLDVDSPSGRGTVLRVCIPVDDVSEIAS